MVNPVVASDGHTYELSQIREWVKRHGRSPITRARLVEGQWFVNYNLKLDIEDWKGAGMPDTYLGSATSRWPSGVQSQNAKASGLRIFLRNLRHVINFVWDVFVLCVLPLVGKALSFFLHCFGGVVEAALCHLEHLWVHRHRSIAIKAALSTLTHLAFLKHVGFPVDVGFGMLYGAFQYHLNRYYPAKSTNVRHFLAQLWGAEKK